MLGDGAGAEGIAGIVAAADRGFDGGIGQQVGAADIDAEAAVGLHQTAVGLAVDQQGDGIALGSVAAHAPGDRNAAGRFSLADDIVGGDVIDLDGRAGRGIHGVLGLNRDGEGVARVVDAADAGIDGGIGRQVGAG